MKWFGMVLMALCATVNVAHATAESATPPSVEEVIADRPASAWDGIRMSMRSGCVANRLKFAAAQPLKAEVMEDACDCLARETTENMRGSPEFRKAMQENDRDAMPGLMQGLQTTKDGKSLFASCTDRAVERQGGLAAATKAPGQVSTVKGLTGPTRVSFISESSSSCATSFANHVKDGKIDSTQLTGFCECMAAGVADKISESDLADGLKSQGRTPAMDEASMQMQRSCSVKFIK